MQSVVVAALTSCRNTYADIFVELKIKQSMPSLVEEGYESPHQVNVPDVMRAALPPRGRHWRTRDPSDATYPVELLAARLFRELIMSHLEVTHHTVTANGIGQHHVEAGEGAPVILLLGFPETHDAWRHQIRRACAALPRHRAGSARLWRNGNAFRRLRQAVDGERSGHALLRDLTIERIALVSHDRGARAATRFVKDHPEVVDGLVVVDNVPTRIVAQSINARIARAYWFFLFHQVPDLRRP